MKVYIVIPRFIFVNESTVLTFVVGSKISPMLIKNCFYLHINHPHFLFIDILKYNLFILFPPLIFIITHRVAGCQVFACLSLEWRQIYIAFLISICPPLPYITFQFILPFLSLWTNIHGEILALA